MREYRESSREKGNRAEDEIYKHVKAKGADIRKNPEGEVDFTVFENGVPRYHIEVEHKPAYAEPRIKKEGVRFLQHKVDKYKKYSLNVYYVIVMDNWNIIYLMDMISIAREGTLVEPESDRKNMGLCYLVKYPGKTIKRRAL